MKRKFEESKGSGIAQGICSGSGATMLARRTLAAKGAPFPARSQSSDQGLKPRDPGTHMLTRSGLTTTVIWFHTGGSLCQAALSMDSQTI